MNRTRIEPIPAPREPAAPSAHELRVVAGVLAATGLAAVTVAVVGWRPAARAVHRATGWLLGEEG